MTHVKDTPGSGPPDSTSHVQELSPDSEPSRKESRLDRYEGLLIAVLLILIVAGNLFSRRVSRRHAFPITVERGEESRGMGPVDWLATLRPHSTQPKDLNSITREDLVALKGIGPSLAAEILDYRGSHGGFRSIEELEEVRGIGPHKLETLRGYLSVSEPIEPASKVSSSTESSSSDPALDREKKDPVTLGESRGKTPPTSLTPDMKPDLNTMTAEELTTLPGIGQSFAHRIIEKRKKLGRFHEWSEVDSIPGIGPKRLENIRNHVTIR